MDDFIHSQSKTVSDIVNHSAKLPFLAPKSETLENDNDKTFPGRNPTYFLFNTFSHTSSHLRTVQFLLILTARRS